MSDLSTSGAPGLSTSSPTTPVAEVAVPPAPQIVFQDVFSLVKPDRPEPLLEDPMIRARMIIAGYPWLWPTRLLGKLGLKALAAKRMTEEANNLQLAGDKRGAEKLYLEAINLWKESWSKRRYDVIASIYKILTQLAENPADKKEYRLKTADALVSYTTSRLYIPYIRQAFELAPDASPEKKLEWARDEATITLERDRRSLDEDNIDNGERENLENFVELANQILKIIKAKGGLHQTETVDAILDIAQEIYQSIRNNIAISSTGSYISLIAIGNKLDLAQTLADLVAEKVEGESREIVVAIINARINFFDSQARSFEKRKAEYRLQELEDIWSGKSPARGPSVVDVPEATQTQEKPVPALKVYENLGWLNTARSMFKNSGPSMYSIRRRGAVITERLADEALKEGDTARAVRLLDIAVDGWDLVACYMNPDHNDAFDANVRGAMVLIRMDELGGEPSRNELKNPETKLSMGHHQIPIWHQVLSKAKAYELLHGEVGGESRQAIKRDYYRALGDWAKSIEALKGLPFEDISQIVQSEMSAEGWYYFDSDPPTKQSMEKLAHWFKEGQKWFATADPTEAKIVLDALISFALVAGVNSHGQILLQLYTLRADLVRRAGDEDGSARDLAASSEIPGEKVIGLLPSIGGGNEEDAVGYVYDDEPRQFHRLLKHHRHEAGRHARSFHGATFRGSGHLTHRASLAARASLPSMPVTAMSVGAQLAAIESAVMGL